MQKIEVVVRRERVDEVKAVLAQQGVEDVLSTDMHCNGRPDAPRAFFRGTAYTPEVGLVKVEAIVDDAIVDTVADAVTIAARTAGIADGHVVVVPIHRAAWFGAEPARLGPGARQGHRPRGLRVVAGPPAGSDRRR